MEKQYPIYNCSQCTATMQKGRLVSNGLVWLGTEKDTVYENVLPGIEGKPAYTVLAYRCTTCNKVDLYTAADEMVV
jgi:DNA-directed RNA polymerase subunit RPC12/RpoP